MTAPCILVVEDDSTIASEIVLGLRQAGFEVELRTSGDGVARDVQTGRFDVVILDLMLPRTSGFDVLAELKHRSTTPILVLTARGELEDRLRSFELGAVDYLSKPFWMAELVARIRARTRKAPIATNRVVRFLGASFDLDACTVHVGDTLIAMTATELRVLTYLCERPGRPVTRDQLVEHVLRAEGDIRSVDAHVARLRKKLGVAGDSIVTVWGIGYRFTPDPTSS
jgi:DNA-binding response OmpR family regulator